MPDWCWNKNLGTEVYFTNRSNTIFWSEKNPLHSMNLLCGPEYNWPLLDHMCKCIVVKSQFWIKFGPQIQKILIDENFIIHLEVYNLLLYMIQPQYVVYVLTGCCKKRGEKRRSIFRLSVSTLSSNTISQQYIILYVERKTICMDTLLYIWYIRLDNTYSVMMDLVR